MIVPVVIVIVWRKKVAEVELYMQVRTDTGELNGMWEFPGGKIENNETAAQAAVREFQEEVSIDLKLEKCQLFKIYPHDYGPKKVLLYTHLYQLDSMDTSHGKWHKLADINDDFKNKIPAANWGIIQDLKSYFKHGNY
ncbi:MAG: NUDIX domain-containing protein [Bacteriovoracaceae bacterium]|nr:NUDIX domain-containing protein [Bacteriovoracaceae bacterium]